MASRALHRVACATTISMLLCARVSRAQLCRGITSIVLRDSTGRLITDEQMKEMNVSFDGHPLRLRSDTGKEAYFEREYVYTVDAYSSKRRDSSWVERAAYAKNPLTTGFCGGISDVTLEHRAKVMQLVLNILPDDAYYEISAPPFQEGTFVLRSRACDSIERPPMIDNPTGGKCRVSADNWSPTPDRVRHLRSREVFGGGKIPLSLDECRRLGTVVITTRDDLEKVWKAYPEATHGNSPPTIDFRWQFMLVVYQTAHSASYSPESIQLDKRGNLRFVPVQAEPADANVCSLLYFQFYRNGVKSVEGKPLPPPP